MYNSFKTRSLLLAILALLGFAAIVGGTALMISPTGELLNLHLSFLVHSPFNNFLLPGVILFFVLGLLPLVLIFALINKPLFILAERLNIYKNMHWAWTFTIYTAFALIIFTQIQMQIERAVHWIETIIILVAICIILLTLLPQIRNQYRKTKRVINPFDLSDVYD